MKRKTNYIISILFFTILTTLISCSTDEETPVDMLLEQPEEITITNISPSEAMSGDTVTITGVNLPLDTSKLNISFGKVAATVIRSSATQIEVIVPEGAENGAVTVSFEGKTFEVGDFVLLTTNGTEPIITKSHPEAGTIGTIVTITGQNFKEDYTTVQFKDLSNGDVVSGVINSITETEIKVQISEKFTGAIYDIDVIVDDTSLKSPNRYVNVVPSISTVSPAYAKAGDIVTVNGFYFSENYGDFRVRIFLDKEEFVDPEIIEVTQSYVKFIAPKVAIGRKVNILVTINGFGDRKSEAFELIGEPFLNTTEDTFTKGFISYGQIVGVHIPIFETVGPTLSLVNQGTGRIYQFSYQPIEATCLNDFRICEYIYSVGTIPLSVPTGTYRFRLSDGGFFVDSKIVKIVAE